MKKYKVLLEGENFEVIFDGERKNLGFYATRVVKANSEAEAEEKASQLINADKNLINMMVENPTIESALHLEGLEEISWWKRTGGSGFSFFPMDSE